jgi:hypothetical protein
LLGIVAEDGGESSDSLDALLFVRCPGGDDLPGRRKEVGGGSDRPVVFRDGRDHPVGWAEVVGGGDAVSPGCLDLDFEEFMVKWCSSLVKASFQ